MQPTTATASPVPTYQRPVNGVVLSGAALLAYTVATSYGWPPDMAVPAALAVGGVLSTVGDATRKYAQRQPPSTLIGEILVSLLTRVG